ncbi:phage tail assembly chaperone [Bosea sp. (in: a-proteobacteria)]|uniref:phage tail assembly chaperone n=1 Tax=Bosea sp. (in: a-proteobacteria) TaxID=1871050 RepID=UPI0039C88274
MPFPWHEVMAFGLGRLGWSPETFWAATPHEIDAALRAHRTGQSPAVPGRDALRALMAAHPDA